MKHKPNYLKSSMSALALSLALLGGHSPTRPYTGKYQSFHGAAYD